LAEKIAVSTHNEGDWGCSEAQFVRITRERIVRQINKALPRRQERVSSARQVQFFSFQIDLGLLQLGPLVERLLDQLRLRLQIFLVGNDNLIKCDDVHFVQ